MKKDTATDLVTDVRNVYDKIAQEFNRSRQRLWPDLDFFTEFLPEDARVLDVGCGNGRLLKFFEGRDIKSYLGIDNSKELLKFAKKQQKGNKIKFKEGDALDLPVKEGTYDAVFSVAVLHHIPSRELQLKALAELSKALSKDGVVCLSVWNLYRLRSLPYFVKAFFRSIFSWGNYSWKDLMIPWGKKEPKMRFAHAFRLKELLVLLQDAGFEVIAEKSTKQGRFGNHLVVARPFLASRTVPVMGVDFHKLTIDEAVAVVARFLRSGEQHMVVTPNPEIVLHGQKDPKYRKILNQASLKIADGIGILWAANLARHEGRLARVGHGLFGLVMLSIKSKGELPERVTGTDLMEKLIHQSHKMGAKIFLLGAAPGVARRVADKWRFDQIVGTFSGSPEPHNDAEIVDRINASEANMVFVAYGAPKQEQWIVRNLKKMPNIRVAIGVGGAFDFIGGVRNRAPKWIRKSGLEWAYRVVQEPRRIKRILNATLVFPYHVMFKRKKD
ncbi:WecB/TagA/CpsF family glycosyltransferase [Candidatus Peregrinibacteria bacterium]|jgi:N-acetylglucosaminyldiphosphoundecaprenol N-acetyl-beta-D-mannosaminyltransferase|nr:WecB/TagA/CpsF family glycosyltransferase [Candidatus Peregrinibacteria bacterium]MBT7484080.1 WecB/TagA/CpsF family glycosyltransferase [Candidatus Peregrinibacteria bacterium]MBT7703517.1 WecB/TagA/CpsF family glycosyltransferase [Candidatus Peregrinibacteria bacterium]